MASNAPGKHYRQGLTLAKLFEMFPDNETAERWFAERRWPNGPVCPHCGHDDVQTGCAHKTMPCRCRGKDCRKRFSTKTGTIMEASNVDYRLWAVAIYLVLTNLKGISSMKLHRDLGVTQKTAWFMLHRIREAWTQTAGEPFAGPVEVDETYVGGKARNMHAHKRAKRSPPVRLGLCHTPHFKSDSTPLETCSSRKEQWPITTSAPRSARSGSSLSAGISISPVLFAETGSTICTALRIRNALSLRRRHG